MPVVPPVYCKKAMSWLVIETGVKDRSLPSAKTCLNATCEEYSSEEFYKYILNKFVIQLSLAKNRLAE